MDYEDDLLYVGNYLEEQQWEENDGCSAAFIFICGGLFIGTVILFALVAILFAVS